jgi:hypothetical protein
MKRIVFTTCFILFYFIVYAQQNKEHISLDLNATGGRLFKTVTVKNQGILFDICNTKTLSYDLVYYDKNMKKKWTYTISKTDLDISNRNQMENKSEDEVFYADGKFIYMHIKFSANGMIRKAYMDLCIDMDGKLIVKNESPLEDKFDYRGLITDKENTYMFFDNHGVGEKQLYYLMAMNPETGAFDKKIILRVPTLKSGEWTYAGNADGKLFFYGCEEQSTSESKNNGLILAFAPVTVEGDISRPFQLRVKLDKYYASNENVGEPLAKVFIDTVTNAMYVYCHMTEKAINTDNDMHQCKGIYINKYDLEGNPIWAKQYNNEDIAKYNSEAASEGLISIYNSYVIIDDSTKDIILVREKGSGGHSAKCFEMDEDGNIKKIVVGEDQSSVFENKAQASVFYSNIQYKDGDYSYYKSIQKIFSVYPPKQIKPEAYLIHLGDKYWMGVMDVYKNTLDIYEL